MAYIPIGITVLSGLGLVVEAQRIAPARECCGRGGLVAAGLLRHAGQSRAGDLSLHHAAGPASDQEEVVTGTGGERVLAHGDTQAGATVHRAAILHEPARRRELGVDHLSGSCFRRR